ncbi:MAG: tocopherol cyclase family protein [Clostridia bacterium]
MKNKFEGYYFRHLKNGEVIAFIPGRSESGAFIQVITNQKSYRYQFEEAKICKNPLEIRIGGCEFTASGIRIRLPDLDGEIHYTGFTPIRSDIMGFFRFFPMECRHGIVSMRHRLSGTLQIEKKRYDFTDGIGYIECDSGRSFPERYIWMQANDLHSQQNMMLSIAKIPFLGFHFEGCICVVNADGKEYRLATYSGAAVRISGQKVIVTQGKLRLEAELLSAGSGHPLAAPRMGKMDGIIRENNDAHLFLRLFSGRQTLCAFESKTAGYENHGYESELKPSDNI